MTVKNSAHKFLNVLENEAEYIYKLHGKTNNYCFHYYIVSYCCYEVL